MNIGCYLISEGKFEKALLPEEILVNLSKSLRNDGVEIVHFENRSILVEGIYIPAKGSKHSIMVLPDVVE